MEFALNNLGSTFIVDSATHLNGTTKADLHLIINELLICCSNILHRQPNPRLAKTFSTGLVLSLNGADS